MDAYVICFVIVLSVVVGVLVRSLQTGASLMVARVSGLPAESAVQDAPVAAVVLDHAAVVRAWNRAAERMFGWSEMEALNRQTPMPASSSVERDAHARALLGETVSGVKASRVTKDGRGIEIDLTVAPLIDRTGAVVGVIEWMAGRAIPQARLRQAERLAAVGQLAAGVVHNFNNLITAVTGHNSLLLEDLTEGNPLRENALQIQTACERAGDLARQLLAFSRGEAVRPALADLNAIVHEVAGLLEPLIGKHVEWALRLDPQAPRIEADSGQIHQALVNLVLNARDAMPGGGTLTIETAGIRVDESAVRLGGQARSWALLAVSDTGTGFAEETGMRLAEPFLTTKRDSGGSGLGLAMAHRAVTEAGGWIRVRSEPDKGARIELYLPQCRPDSIAGEMG